MVAFSGPRRSGQENNSLLMISEKMLSLSPLFAEEEDSRLTSSAPRQNLWNTPNLPSAYCRYSDNALGFSFEKAGGSCFLLFFWRVRYHPK